MADARWGAGACTAARSGAAAAERIEGMVGRAARCTPTSSHAGAPTTTSFSPGTAEPTPDTIPALSYQGCVCGTTVANYGVTRPTCTTSATVPRSQRPVRHSARPGNDPRRRRHPASDRPDLRRHLRILPRRHAPRPRTLLTGSTRCATPNSAGQRHSPPPGLPRQRSAPKPIIAPTAPVRRPCLGSARTCGTSWAWAHGGSAALSPASGTCSGTWSNAAAGWARPSSSTASHWARPCQARWPPRSSCGSASSAGAGPAPSPPPPRSSPPLSC